MCMSKRRVDQADDRVTKMTKSDILFYQNMFRLLYKNCKPQFKVESLPCWHVADDKLYIPDVQYDTCETRPPCRKQPAVEPELQQLFWEVQRSPRILKNVKINQKPR